MIPSCALQQSYLLKPASRQNYFKTWQTPQARVGAVCCFSYCTWGWKPGVSDQLATMRTGYLCLHKAVLASYMPKPGMWFGPLPSPVPVSKLLFPKSHSTCTCTDYVPQKTLWMRSQVFFAQNNPLKRSNESAATCMLLHFQLLFTLTSNLFELELCFLRLFVSSFLSFLTGFQRVRRSLCGCCLEVQLHTVWLTFKPQSYYINDVCGGSCSVVVNQQLSFYPCRYKPGRWRLG